MKPVVCQRSCTLYQALSPCQFTALVRADWRRIEPGRGGELFCYLKLQQRYAEMIARQRLVPESGAGFVVRLTLPEEALLGFELETVAYEEHLEYRVPVPALPALSLHLQGAVRLVSVFREQHSYSVPAQSAPGVGAFNSLTRI